MAIVQCKECRGKVSSTAPACPHCGAPRPGQVVGALVVNRSSSFTLNELVQVCIGRNVIGELACGERLVIELPIGPHELVVGLPGDVKVTTVQIRENQTAAIEVTYNWGLQIGMPKPVR